MNSENSTSTEKKHLPQLATVYTEVSPNRTKKILEGIFESTSTSLQNPMRWFAELSLNFYQPDELKGEGVSRKQSIFTSPIPYQGQNPIEGRVLLALDVGHDSTYVAEAQHITNFWHIGAMGINNITILKNLIKAPPEGINQEEFQIKFETAPRETKDQLIESAKNLAEAYWKSVVSFTKYLETKIAYEEPEILMTKETKITNVRYASVPL